MLVSTARALAGLSACSICGRSSSRTPCQLTPLSLGSQCWSLIVVQTLSKDCTFNSRCCGVRTARANRMGSSRVVISAGDSSVYSTLFEAEYSGCAPSGPLAGDHVDWSVSAYAQSYYLARCVVDEKLDPRNRLAAGLQLRPG